MFGVFGCPISPSTVGQAMRFYPCKMIDFFAIFSAQPTVNARSFYHAPILSFVQPVSHWLFPCDVL